MPAKRPAPTLPVVADDSQPLSTRFSQHPDHWDFRDVRTAQVLYIFADRGLSARMLQWWDERKVLVPRMQGHTRSYSIEDIIVVGVILELRDHDFSLQRIRRILRTVEPQLRGQAYVLPNYLIVDNKTAYCELSPERALARMCRTKGRTAAVDLRAILYMLEQRWDQVSSIGGRS